jgi:hypothetical protein
MQVFTYSICLYRPCCHGNNSRSNIAVTVYSLNIRLVVSGLLLLEMLYQIQMCLKVVQIHQSMYAYLHPPDLDLSWSWLPTLLRSLLICNLIRSAISLPGSKQKSASDDRDSALAGLLQEKSGGRLGPQWIRPTPPRLPVLDGEVKYFKSCIFISVLFLNIT